MDWLPYDRDLRHERVEIFLSEVSVKGNSKFVSFSVVITVELNFPFFSV